MAINQNVFRYILFALILLLGGYIVFRIVVRRSYRQHGRLTWPASLLQLLTFVGVMSFPTLFNPPEWSRFWVLDGPGDPTVRAVGLLFILLGFGTAFGTMFWFGLRRAFGVQIQGIVRQGPYRVSRNPQVLGGYLLVMGAAVQWFSWFALGWIALYGLITHWMILTEEEHLEQVFGEDYRQFCEEVPRYLIR
jgi:protein-S-isoprenylcysteine O-methyltransferase Ste14